MSCLFGNPSRGFWPPPQAASLPLSALFGWPECLNEPNPQTGVPALTSGSRVGVKIKYSLLEVKTRVGVISYLSEQLAEISDCHPRQSIKL